MKTVLIVTNIPSPYRVRFFDELGKLFDLTVVFTDKSEDHGERDKEWYIEASKQFRAVYLQKRKSLPAGQFVCTDVLDWVKKPFDHILLFGYAAPTLMLAQAWLRLHRKPFAIEIDGGLLAPESGLKRSIKRLLIGGASDWFSTGQMTDEFLTHYGAKPEKLHFYPFSSVEEQDLLPAPTIPEQKAALRQELGITEKNVILAVGQFIPRKGFDVLLRGAKNLLPDTGIFFVGGQPTEDYLQLAEQSGNTNIHFVGFCKKQELAKYYMAADVFALPTREDIWGLVINEAMGYGLPIVTTDRCVAGVELIENGVNGYLVPTEDADALVQKLNLVLTSDLTAMGRASLAAIRPYTIQAMARAHRDALG